MVPYLCLICRLYFCFPLRKRHVSVFVPYIGDSNNMWQGSPFRLVDLEALYGVLVYISIILEGVLQRK